MLHRALTQAAEAIRAGAPIADTLDAARRMVTEAGFVLDYLEARHAATLAPVSRREDGPLRLLVAAVLGATRLIDNLAV